MLSILLVDDDREFLYTTHELLVVRGFDVHTAASVPEALKLMEDNPADVVVADIIIPEHDGFELIMRLKKTHPQTRIIAMSGGGKIEKETYLNMAQGIRADTTIAKPFRIEELVKTINSLFE